MSTKSRSSLITRALALVAGNSLASLATFVMMAFIARMTTISDFGKISYGFNIATLITLFTSLGIPSFLVVICHREDTHVIPEVNLLALLSLLLAAPLIACCAALIWRIGLLSASGVAAVCLAGIAGMVVPHIAGICQAAGRWSEIGKFQVISNAVRAIFVILVLSLGRPQGFEAVLWASTLGSILGSFYIARLMLQSLRCSSAFHRIREHFVDFRNIALTNTVTVLNLRADVVLAGALLSPQDLGAYTAANTLVLGMAMIQSAVMAVSLHDSSLAGCDLSLMSTRLRQLLPAISVGIVITILLSSKIVPLLFGPRYLPAISPFTFLCVATFLGILFVPMESHLLAFDTGASLILKLIQFAALILSTAIVGRSSTSISCCVLISRIIGWGWAFAYLLRHKKKIVYEQL